MKVESLAALCTRLGENLDSVTRARWGGRGLTDVDCALIASDWLRSGGRLQGLVELDMAPRDAGGTPNSFGVRGVRALAAALPSLASLTKLSLERGSEVPSVMLQGTAPSTINLSGPYRTSASNLTSSSPKRFSKLLSPEVEIMQNLCKPSPKLQSINRLRSKIGGSAASSALIIHHS